jgi:hypothetical protein
VWANGFKKAGLAQGVGHGLRHAVLRIGFATMLIPKMMGYEFEQQRFGRGPRKSGVCRCQ